MRIPPLLAVLCLTILACSHTEDDSSPLLNEQIQPWADNPDYWAWGTTEPTLLLGLLVPGNEFLDPLFEQPLASLAAAGGNYLHLIISPLPHQGLAPFLPNTSDLNPAYWERLEGLVAKAAKRKVVVQLQLPTLVDTRDVAGTKRYLDQVLNATAAYGNVLYQIGDPDMPPATEAYYRSYLRQQAGTNGDSIYLTTHNPLYDGIGDVQELNRAVINGQTVVGVLPRSASRVSYGQLYSAIRAIRTIERQVHLRDFHPAPQYIDDAVPTAYAARDSIRGSLLVYLPSAGEVTISHGFDPQVALRFTRVGYLGTKRSERLEPPYSASFRMFTEEERGGWMLLESL